MPLSSYFQVSIFETDDLRLRNCPNLKELCKHVPCEPMSAKALLHDWMMGFQNDVENPNHTLMHDLRNFSQHDFEKPDQGLLPVLWTR